MVELTILVPGWRAARSGEFAMVRLADSRRFLPRAFSVYSERPAEAGEYGTRVAFLISPIGPGTTELVAASEGSEVWVVGPLGRPFDIDALSQSETGAGERPGPAGPRLLVVAGGVGAAPFLLLLERLADRMRASAGRPAEVLVLLGFRDSPQAAVLDAFEPALAALDTLGMRARLETICEDGSLGREGLVTDLLSEELGDGDALFCCGAHAMCEAVWDLCGTKEGVQAWFSLEAGMACGVGSCQGCVIPMADGSLVRVCREGPVFSGEEAFGETGHPCLTGGGAS
jgi:dihydroorotate dehydrogenase electron transfer subunit